MLFKKKEIPAVVEAAGLSKWYSKLSDQNTVKLKRYLGKAEGVDAQTFLLGCIRASNADENWAFTMFLCDEAYSFNPDDLQSFLINEELIDAYFFSGRYDDAMAACKTNMELYPKVKEGFLALNSGEVPWALRFRNRQVDIMVGVNSDYDGATAIMDQYVELGVLSEEEAKLRKESIKIRRMQRCLDGIFCYTYKEESEK